MTPAIVNYRRIRTSADLSWRPFMKIYEESFEEGQRETERAIRQNLDTDVLPRRGGLLVIVAEEYPGACLGGVLFSYLSAVDCGYISYLVVAAHLRSRGIGSRLLGETRAYLEDEASRAGGRIVRGVFTELEREDPRDPDTYRRFRFWERNGVRPLACDWRYPPLHGGQPPVPMYLAFGGYDAQLKWYPADLKRAAQAIFAATYAYLPSASVTLKAITDGLDRLQARHPVPYVTPLSSGGPLNNRQAMDQTGGSF